MKPTSEENATLPRIQAYSKSQLATLYLPHIQPASARRTLRKLDRQEHGTTKRTRPHGIFRQSHPAHSGTSRAHLPFLGGALIRA
ncbi:DUF4248 domain-containing protein [Bacteroides thetaiotaomicron]|nr:DUF4248 domain-containing protein [Bacteroides thetaiotaomicron]